VEIEHRTESLKCLIINSDILTIRAEEFKESWHRELMLEFLIMVDVSEARSTIINLLILCHRQKVVYELPN
jgi:hypothetical protein